MTENSCVSKMATEWHALKGTFIVASSFSAFAPLSQYLALWFSSPRRWEAPFPFLFSIFCAFCLFSPHLKHDLLSLISPTLSLYGPLCLSPLSKSVLPGLCPFSGSLSLSPYPQFPLLPPSWPFSFLSLPPFLSLTAAFPGALLSQPHGSVYVWVLAAGVLSRWWRGLNERGWGRGGRTGGWRASVRTGRDRGGELQSHLVLVTEGGTGAQDVLFLC